MVLVFFFWRKDGRSPPTVASAQSQYSEAPAGGQSLKSTPWQQWREDRKRWLTRSNKGHWSINANLRTTCGHLWVSRWLIRLSDREKEVQAAARGSSREGGTHRCLPPPHSNWLEWHYLQWEFPPFQWQKPFDDLLPKCDFDSSGSVIYELETSNEDKRSQKDGASCTVPAVLCMRKYFQVPRTTYKIPVSQGFRCRNRQLLGACWPGILTEMANSRFIEKPSLKK